MKANDIVIGVVVGLAITAVVMAAAFVIEQNLITALTVLP